VRLVQDYTAAFISLSLWYDSFAFFR
jgi:hypothetical protein